MPPIHPAFVHLPIALMTLSAIAEVWGWLKASQPARSVAWWSLVGAALGGSAAAAAGYYDMNAAALSVETHELVNIHQTTGFTLVGALWVLALWRWLTTRKPDRQPGAAYVVAAVLVFGLTAFQGWFGGELVYGYGAGVAPAGQGTEQAAEARQRLQRLFGPVTGGEPAGHTEGAADRASGASH